MDSYDRLFPSQDTMPRGGFGNLIALPFQQGPRRVGNSVFLDENLEPYPSDQQWSYLASVQRIDPAVVDGIAAEATRDGMVLGASLADPTDEEDAAPWTRSPSKKRRPRRIVGPLPARVAVTVAQAVFVEKAGLPSSLLNEIKRLAAFQNPEFYKKQSMRLSTALTPRVIACAEDLPLHIGLPRGCLYALEELLRSHDIALEVTDQRTNGEAIDVTFRGALTALQTDAARAMLAHDAGVFVAPPGTARRCSLRMSKLPRRTVGELRSAAEAHNRREIHQRHRRGALAQHPREATCAEHDKGGSQDPRARPTQCDQAGHGFSGAAHRFGRALPSFGPETRASSP